MSGWRNNVQDWLRFMLSEWLSVILSLPISFPLWWKWEFALSSQQVGPNNCSNAHRQRERDTRHKEREREREREGKEGKGLTGKGKGNPSVFYAVVLLLLVDSYSVHSWYQSGKIQMLSRLLKQLLDAVRWCLWYEDDDLHMSDTNRLNSWYVFSYFITEKKTEMNPSFLPH